jgi:uncharacterized protein YndB with AHSA1/START domain
MSISTRTAAGADSTADREFVHSRLIDAPRERVFEAFADPCRLARWWRPDGEANPQHTRRSTTRESSDDHYRHDLSPADAAHA